MRAITIQQPYASAIALMAVFPTLAKPVENRGRYFPWTDAIGERVAIHAGKGWDRDAISLTPGSPWLPLLEALIAVAHPELGDTYPTAMLLPYLLRETYPAGAVIATAVLTDVHEGARCDSCGPWSQPDQWHLCLNEVEPVSPAAPADGALGWWTWAG